MAVREWQEGGWQRIGLQTPEWGEERHGGFGSQNKGHLGLLWAIEGGEKVVAGEEKPRGGQLNMQQW